MGGVSNAAIVQIRTILTHMEVPSARIEQMMAGLFSERLEDAAEHVGEGAGGPFIHSGAMQHD